MRKSVLFLIMFSMFVLTMSSMVFADEVNLELQDWRIGDTFVQLKAEPIYSGVSYQASYWYVNDTLVRTGGSYTTFKDGSWNQDFPLFPSTEYNFSIIVTINSTNYTTSRLITTAPSGCEYPISESSYPSSEIVTFCSGTYNVSGMSFLNNIILDGTHLVNDNKSGNMIEMFYTTINKTILCQNGAIIDGGNYENTRGIYQGEWASNDDSIDIEGCTFQNFDSSANAIYLQTSDGSKIINNNFTDSNVWINNRYNVIDGNIFNTLVELGTNNHCSSSDCRFIGNITNNEFNNGMTMFNQNVYVSDENWIVGNYFGGGDVTILSTISEPNMYFINNTIDGVELSDSDDGDVIVYCLDGNGNDFINGATYVGDNNNSATCPLPLEQIVITDISATSSINSIDVTAIAGQQIESTDWYVDGVFYETVNDISTTIEGLNPDTEYNISVTAHNSVPSEDTYSELISTNPIVCVNPVTDMVITEDTWFCSGDFDVRNIEIQDDVDLTFQDTNLHYDSDGGDPTSDTMLIMTGNDITIDCNSDRSTTGFIEGQVDGEDGTRGIGMDESIQRGTIRNCILRNHQNSINAWGNQQDMVFEDLILQGGVLHGGGDRAYYHNIDTNNGDYPYVGIFLFGHNITFDNVYSSNEQYAWVGLAHPDSELASELPFSGTIMNSELSSIWYGDAFDYETPYNITNNVIHGDVTLIGGFGDQFFYDNDVQYFEDHTDWGAGEYITFCVDGIGNNINDYNGANEDSGTCPPTNCADSFESGCRITSDVTLTTGTYNVVDIFTGNSEPVTLDCQGSVIRGDWTAEGEDRSNFIKIYNEDVTIENCVFEDYWSIINVQNENSYGLVFDNVRWESNDVEWQYYCNDPEGEEDPEQCNDPSFWVERPTFNLNAQRINGMTLQNSYFGGTTYFRIEKPYWVGGGDYCPDGSGEYSIGSENCVNWEYGTEESECKPEMWNGTTCLDSRGTWQDGNCNECSVDWNYVEGQWYACDYSDNVDGFNAINNIFNTTSFESNDDDNMWFTLYTVDNILIENNTWYGRDVGDYDTKLMRISGSNGATIKGNDIYGGQGFSITPHDWEEPKCMNNNIIIEDNTFHLSTPTFWYNWFTSMNNSVIRNNVCDFNNNPELGMCMYINNDIGDQEMSNLDIYGNEFINYAEPYDCGSGESYYPCDDLTFVVGGWTGIMNNVNIYDNTFQGEFYLYSDIHTNFNMYNNFIQILNIDSMFSPETNTGADICYGGTGNTYETILIDVSTSKDKWFNPLCSVLNVPNGIWLQAYSNPETTPITINATGVTLTGNSEYGLYYIGNWWGNENLRQLKDISVYGLSIEGFNRSIFFNQYSQDSLFSGNVLDKWYVDEGSNNVINYNSYTCAENYAPTYTSCINGTHTVDYVDLNDCGSTTYKPDSFQENCSLEIDCGQRIVYQQGTNYVMENDCISIVLKKQYSPTLEIYNITETEEYNVGTNKKWKMVVQGIEERDLESENTTFIDFSDFDWNSTVQDGWIEYTTDTFTLTYVVDEDTAKTDLTINSNFVYQYEDSELWLKTYYKTGAGDYIRYTEPIVDNITMPVVVEYVTEPDNKMFSYQNLYRGLDIYVDPIYEPCIEWWQPEYSTCGVDDQQLLTYYDANVCGSDVDLPEDNNTMVYCNFCTPTFGLLKGVCENSFQANATYYLTNEESCCALTNLSTDCDVPADTRVNCAGLHSTNDITGLVFDTGVEIGRNYVAYAGLIALIGLVIWGVALI